MVNETISLHHIIVICIVTQCGWPCRFMWRASGYDETAELYYHLMLSNGLSNLQTNATK